MFTYFIVVVVCLAVKIYALFKEEYVVYFVAQLIEFMYNNQLVVVKIEEVVQLLLFILSLISTLSDIRVATIIHERVDLLTTYVILSTIYLCTRVDKMRNILTYALDKEYQEIH